MKTRDLWQLAWRGLTRRPVRTILTALGITVAVASMVIFLSLGEGLRKVFTAELGSIGPDIQVSLNGFTQGLAPSPSLSQSTVADIQKLAPALGITVITPVVMSLRTSLDPSQSVVFYGVPAAQGVLTAFPKLSLSRGKLFTAADEGKPVAVLGAKAASNLRLKIGSELRLNRRSSVRVTGILNPDSALTDNFIFLPISTLQNAIDAQGKLSLVAVKLQDPRQARAVADALIKNLNLEAQTQSERMKAIR